MENDWVSVYCTNKPYEAELVKGLLENVDIEPIVMNKQDSSYMFGEIEIFVHPQQAEQALNIINSHNNE